MVAPSHINRRGLSFDFSAKSVFVAGGTSGINLGIAKAFAEAGASVGVISRSQDKVDAAVEALAELEARAYGWSADVRNAEAVDAAVDAFAGAVGGIDIVVSGAAGNFLALAKDLSSNGFKTVVDIDLLGTFNVMKAAYPRLNKPGACLINISAPQAYMPIERQVHACAAKAGIDQVTRVLAKEWGPEGVRVNSISPGPIAGTEGLERLAPNDDAVVESVPLRRLGTRDDIAAMAMFLASDAGAFISGAVIPVDGGWGL
ncbi:MAG: hypothetical protein RIR33_413 [Pseudomonadota bacterium]